MEQVVTADEMDVSAKNERARRCVKILLSLSIFFSGACALVDECLLSTVSSLILGNSIQEFSVTISLMLLMMGMGAWGQKFMSDKGLVEKFAGVEVLLALLGGFSPIAIYAAFGLLSDHFQLVHYFFVCSIGFLIGFELPLVMRINNQFSKNLGTNIAEIFCPDFIGSCVGGLFWTFILLRRFPLTEISIILAGVNLFVAIMTLLYFMKQGMVKHKVMPLVAVGLMSIALCYGFAKNRDWSKYLSQRFYDNRIVASMLTDYQWIVMTQMNTKTMENGRVDINEVFINGNKQFSSEDEHIYHEQLVHPIMKLVPDHANALVLGGGDGLAARELLKYDDLRSITLVDIDYMFVEFCATNPIMREMNQGAFDDARVQVVKSGAITADGWRPIYMESGEDDEEGNAIAEKVAEVSIINIDADRFIDEIGERWNVIIIDMPDPNAVELAKLYSKEFFLKVRRILSERGMIVIQATSPYHSKQAFLCCKKTMEAAGFTTLPYHDNVPSFGDWGFILGWKKPNPSLGAIDQMAVSPEGMKKRIERIESFDVETRYLTPDVFRSATVFGRGMLESSIPTPVSTIMEPAIMSMYIYDGWAF